MKEFKFTGTMRPERIMPDDRCRSAYQIFRRDVINSSGEAYPEVEVIIRVHDLRQDWIDKWYAEAQRRGVNLIFRKDVVIAYNDWGDIATAAPVRGDKYDRHTGVAVACAKLCGESVPDYI